MKKRKGCLVAVLLFFMVDVVAAVSPSEALVDLLSHYKTFQARFTQRTYSVQNKLIAKSRGRCLIQRPHFFRWETRSPNDQAVIGDGQFIWVYDVDLMQATRRVVSPSKWSPAQLLMGNSQSLSQHFTVKQEQHQKQLIFILSQKKKQTFKRVEFIFQKKKLRQLLVTNALNQLAVFQFSRALYNKKIPQSQFRFVAPSGVDVIHVTQ